jgi:hypothetical protein
VSDWLTLTISTVSLVFSCVSTVVAGLTAFFTFFRRPKIKMTRPNYVVLAFDGEDGLPKVFTRSLIYCTAEPGKVVETLYARVCQNGTQATYTFWSYYLDGRLVAGGGLFVGTAGIATDHHFVLRKGAVRPLFAAGPVSVEIAARVVGERNEQQLCQVELKLTEEQATALNDGSAGVEFERSPDSDRFHAESKPNPAMKRRHGTLNDVSLMPGS